MNGETIFLVARKVVAERVLKSSYFLFFFFFFLIEKLLVGVVSTNIL